MKIKKLWTLALLACFAALPAECGFAADGTNSVAASSVPAAETNKIIIVYYSKTGNTEEIAKLIKNTVGGDLARIEPKTPYPADYRATTEQAKKEIEIGFKPPLKTTVEDIERYDIIFVGSPNWWSTIAPPVATFLSAHDFSGKTIIPFMTHGGTGLGRAMDEIKKHCPGSTLLAGQAFTGSNVENAREDVEKWLRQIKLLKQ